MTPFLVNIFVRNKRWSPEFGEISRLLLALDAERTNLQT